MLLGVGWCRFLVFYVLCTATGIMPITTRSKVSLLSRLHALWCDFSSSTEMIYYSHSLAFTGSTQLPTCRSVTRIYFYIFKRKTIIIIVYKPSAAGVVLLLMFRLASLAKRPVSDACQEKSTQTSKGMSITSPDKTQCRERNCSTSCQGPRQDTARNRSLHVDIVVQSEGAPSNIVEKKYYCYWNLYLTRVI